jgi:hypothetical protein
MIRTAHSFLPLSDDVAADTAQHPDLALGMARDTADTLTDGTGRLVDDSITFDLVAIEQVEGAINVEGQRGLHVTFDVDCVE